jgi:hypothetical protein
MAPIFEADAAMRPRRAALRLAPVSPSVAQFLDRVGAGRTLPSAEEPERDRGPEEPDPDGGGPRPCPDGHGQDRPSHRLGERAGQ